MKLRGSDVVLSAGSALLGYVVGAWVATRIAEAESEPYAWPDGAQFAAEILARRDADARRLEASGAIYEGVRAQYDGRRNEVHDRMWPDCDRPLPHGHKLGTFERDGMLFEQEPFDQDGGRIHWRRLVVFIVVAISLVIVALSLHVVVPLH